MVQIYDAMNYTLGREDIGDTSIYYFSYISFVIRNIPVLPYVVQSQNISVKVYNRSVISSESIGDTKLPTLDGPKSLLAECQFNYTPVAELTAQVGAVIDRDYFYIKKDGSYQAHD